MKNKKTLAILCSSAFVMALVLSGCFNKAKNNNQESTGENETSLSESGETVQTWTVTFNSQGGSSVAAQKVKNGETAKRPTDPTKTNFSFTGWYEEPAAVTPFDFATKITTDWTLYAGWQAGGGGDSSSSSSSEDSSTTTSESQPVDEYDFYVNIGGTEYGLEKQTYALQENQVAEYRVDVPAVSAGQGIFVLDSNKNELTDNFGAEPGDNNVDEAAGFYTVHNNAEPAFVLVKTWESGWTNFYVSGYQAEPQPEEVYYVLLDGSSYEMQKQSYDLLENQVAEFRVDVGNIIAGQTLEFQDANHNTLSENFGAEPGQNNVSGDVGSFTVRNNADDAFIILKTWESGWTNFYVSGYEATTPTENGHGPEGSELVSWYIVGQGSLFTESWSIDGGVQLFSNPSTPTDKGCILSITIEEGNIFKVTDGDTWFGYEKVDTWDNPSNLGINNFSPVDDGYGGTNIKCNITGVYDIYVNSSGNFWIQAAAEA